MGGRWLCALALGATCFVPPISGLADPLDEPVAGPLAMTRTEDVNGAWTAMLPIAGRYLHTAVYDPVRDRMIVFGGWASFNNQPGEDCNQTWALSLSGDPTWSLIEPTTPPPPRRSQPISIYDPNGDRLIVLGGWHSTTLSDLWALSLSGDPAWTQLTPAGP